VATLLGIPVEVLTDALTHRTVASRGESIKSPLSAGQAVYARDALAKSMLVVLAGAQPVGFLSLMVVLQVQPRVFLARGASEQGFGRDQTRRPPDCHGLARHLRVRNHEQQQLRAGVHPRNSFSMLFFSH
jgi:hypothetical protein